MATTVNLPRQYQGHAFTEDEIDRLMNEERVHIVLQAPHRFAGYRVTVQLQEDDIRHRHYRLVQVKDDPTEPPLPWLPPNLLDAREYFDMRAGTRELVRDHEVQELQEGLWFGTGWTKEAPGILTASAFRDDACYDENGQDYSRVAHLNLYTGKRGRRGQKTVYVVAEFREGKRPLEEELKCHDDFMYAKRVQRFESFREAVTAYKAAVSRALRDEDPNRRQHELDLADLELAIQTPSPFRGATATVTEEFEALLASPDSTPLAARRILHETLKELQAEPEESRQAALRAKCDRTFAIVREAQAQPNSHILGPDVRLEYATFRYLRTFQRT